MNPWYEKKLAAIKKLKREDFLEPSCDVCGGLGQVYLTSEEYTVCEECFEKLFPEDET